MTDVVSLSTGEEIPALLQVERGQPHPTFESRMNRERSVPVRLSLEELEHCRRLESFDSLAWQCRILFAFPHHRNMPTVKLADRGGNLPGHTSKQESHF